MGAAVSDCIVAFAGVVGAVCGDRADLFIVRDLAEQFRQLGKSKQAKSPALHLLGRSEGISMIGHVYADPALITAEIKTLQKWIDEL